tara:strand:+ start:1062 stop:1745 length:684 start_codon:yes stop_codon:yes gene_type:complete
MNLETIAQPKPLESVSPHPGLFMSPQIDKLAGALAKAQGEIKSAVKDSVNPHFKSKYADIASIDEASKEALSKHGLSVAQLPRADGTKVTLIYVLMHESGQFLGSDLTMKAQQDTPQAVGSCITYERRYTKAALVGISQDDDDGNSASGKENGPARNGGKAVRGDVFTGADFQMESLKAAAKSAGLTNMGQLEALKKRCHNLEMKSLLAAAMELAQELNPSRGVFES